MGWDMLLQVDGMGWDGVGWNEIRWVEVGLMDGIGWVDHR